MADIFFTGGLNERDDLNIPVEECIEGQNFRLDSQAKTFRPRLPFDQVGLATAGGVVTGIMQLIKRDDSDTLIVAAGATMYSVDDNYAFTSAGSVATDSGFLSSYWSLDEKLVITDIKLNNVIHEWDGSTFQKCGHGIGEGVVNSASGITRSGTTATCTVTAHGYSNGDMVTIAGTTETEYNGEFIISNVSADTFDYTVSGSPSTPASGAPTAERSVDLYAKYGVVFNNRVWLFNIKEVNNATSTTSLNPHMILVSEFEEYNKFDITQRAGTATDQGYTGNEAFFLLSPDLKPINGAINFFDTLVFSTTDGQLFNFTGTDASNYSIDPFYHGSAATGTRTMVNIGNDAIYMKRGGRLDTLSATERFGDVQADDISRFIPDQTSGLSDGISVYDQNKQIVYIFVTDKVLVLHKDMVIESPQLSPWSVYKTQHPNGFNTEAASYIRVPASGEYDVFFGDDSGKLYRMNGTAGSGDAATYDILSYRKTRFINDSEIPARFRNLLGQVEYRRRGSASLICTFDFADSGVSSSCSVPLSETVTSGTPYFYNDGEAYWNDDQYWNEGAVVADVIATNNFSPTGKGRGFFLETRINTKVNFLINRVIL